MAGYVTPKIESALIDALALTSISEGEENYRALGNVLEVIVYQFISGGSYTADAYGLYNRYCEKIDTTVAISRRMGKQKLRALNFHRAARLHLKEIHKAIHAKPTATDAVKRRVAARNKQQGRI